MKLIGLRITPIVEGATIQQVDMVDNQGRTIESRQYGTFDLEAYAQAINEFLLNQVSTNPER